MSGVLSSGSYYVACDLTVPKGSTWELSSGVELEFGIGKELNVDGKLLISGLLGDSVKMHSVADTTWTGINLKGEIEGDYVVFEDVKKVVEADSFNVKISLNHIRMSRIENGIYLNYYGIFLYFLIHQTFLNIVLVMLV